MENSKQVWHGNEKDVNWEVARWMCGEEVAWNTYLYIYDKNMVDKLWTRKYRKYSCGKVFIPKSILENLSWNGGQTYYHQVIDCGQKYIVIGDDYLHSWDKGNAYNENVLIDNIKMIAEELKTAISKL